MSQTQSKIEVVILAVVIWAVIEFILPHVTLFLFTMVEDLGGPSLVKLQRGLEYASTSTKATWALIMAGIIYIGMAWRLWSLSKREENDQE